MDRLLEWSIGSGPWAVGGVLLFFLLKSLIARGFKIEVPPNKPKR